MKRYILNHLYKFIGLPFVTCSFVYGVICVNANEFQSITPVTVEYFKPGQILLPDYACGDTLIVKDAEGLNRDMAFIEQGLIESSDEQIDSTFHLYCTIK